MEFNIESQTAMKLLSSKSIYQKGEAFLMEMLINAIDACLCREAIQFGWGSGFFEIEEYENNEIPSCELSELQAPRVKISLSIQDRTISVEDNGIGMSMDDFKRYFLAIGESYYLSDEFRAQRVQYEPFSRFGMGVLAYLNVANEIEVDSLKHPCMNTAWKKYDSTEFRPIRVAFSKSSGQFLEKKSMRAIPGTKVSLCITDEAMTNISLEEIERRIRNRFSVLPVEIELEDENDTRIIEPYTFEIDRNLYGMAGIKIIEIDDSIMNGYIFLYSKNMEDYLPQGSLFQKGLLIEKGDEIKDLYPEWIENMSIFINLKNQFLNLHLGKDKAIRDRKFNALRTRIGSEVMKYLKSSPVISSQFFSDGRKNVISRFPAEMIFLAKNINVSVIIKGNYLQINLEELRRGIEGREICIAIMHHKLYEWIGQYGQNWLSEEAVKYDLILLDTNARIALQYFGKYIVRKEYVVAKTSGIIFLEIEIRVADFELSLDNEEIQWQCLGCADENIICYISNEQSNILSLRYNEDHPFLKYVFSPKASSEMQRAWNVIAENICRRIVQNKSSWNEIIDFGLGMFVPWNNSERIPSVNAVGCLEPGFVEMANDYLLSKSTEEEKKYLLDGDLLLKKKDFVGWWFRE